MKFSWQYIASPPQIEWREHETQFTTQKAAAAELIKSNTSTQKNLCFINIIEY